MSGRHLKKLRLANGFSQNQVAKELHIDRAKVSRWENDIILPNDDDILALADLYFVEAETIKESIRRIDRDDYSCESGSIIAERIDELHISVSNELNAAIANQEQSIKQQARQIEDQKETLKLYADKLDENSKMQDFYFSELEKNREEYRKTLSCILIGTVVTVLILAFVVFAMLLVLNHKNKEREYDVTVPAVEITEEVK